MVAKVIRIGIDKGLRVALVALIKVVVSLRQEFCDLMGEV